MIYALCFANSFIAHKKNHKQIIFIKILSSIISTLYFFVLVSTFLGQYFFFNFSLLHFCSLKRFSWTTEFYEMPDIRYPDNKTLMKVVHLTLNSQFMTKFILTNPASCWLAVWTILRLYLRSIWGCWYSLLS